MAEANLSRRQAACPTGARAEIGLLSDYAPHVPQSEVPDQYHHDGFDHVLDLLEQANRGLAQAPKSA